MVHPDATFLVLLNGIDAVLASIIAAGLVRVALRFSRNEKGTIADFLPARPSAFRFLEALLLYGFATGIIFLIFFVGFTLLNLARPFVSSTHAITSWWTILPSALGAVMVFFAMQGGIRLIEWQFFGHAVLTRG